MDPLSRCKASDTTNHFLKAVLVTFISGKDCRKIHTGMTGYSICQCNGLVGLCSNTAFDKLFWCIHIQHFFKPLFNQCILRLLHSPSYYHFSSSFSTSLSLLSFHALDPGIGKFHKFSSVAEKGRKKWLMGKKNKNCP